jgi:ankyrin repeat protein
MLLAAATGQDDSIRMLLMNNANINCQNSFGRTPLHCASANEQLTTIMLLLDKQADANIRDLLERRPNECTDNFLVAELISPYMKESPTVLQSIGDLLTLKTSLIERNN